MNFVEYCNKRIKEIEEGINEITFLESTTQPITYSGTKKELLKRYYEDKGRKLKNIIFKPSENELKNYILELESCKLKQKKASLTEELDQLLKGIQSFSEGTFHAPVIPNNYLIKNIIFFSSKSNTKIEDIIKLLISLFKNNPKENINIIIEIENRIANSYDENYRIMKNYTSSIVNFLVEKLLLLVLSEEEQLEYSICINGLLTEINLNLLSDPRNQDEKNELETKKKAIAELKQYICDGKIVYPAPTIEYFETLLNIASVPRIQAMNYIADMEVLIATENEKTNNIVLKNFLSEQEQDVYQNAQNIAKNIEVPETKALFNRFLKDVTSICKYITQVCPPEELQTTYEALANKVFMLKLLIQNIEEHQTIDDTASYLTDNEEFPIILRNIETMDIVLYPEAHSLLQILKESNTEHKKINNINGIDLFCLSGTNLSLLYTKNGKNIVIISFVDSKLEQSYNSFSKEQLLKLQNLLKNHKTEQQKTAEAICEKLITQSLTFETTRITDKDYKGLKKD